MIRQKSSNALKVIQILQQLPQVPMPLRRDDVGREEPTAVILTPSEITEVIRFLKANNPGVATVIRASRLQFPRDEKFNIRQIQLDLAMAIASAQIESEPRKLHRL